MSNKNWGKIAANLGLVSQIGIAMVIPIFGCVYVGNLIDEKFKTSPLFLFIFIVLGVGAAFLNLYELTFKGTKKKRRK